MVSTRQALDALVARALVERGLVSEKALAHAFAVQRRGYAGNPIDELLVDLELVSSGVITKTLSEVTGAPIWDGEGLDAQLVLDLTVSSAGGAIVPVRRAGSTLVYATTAPHDEGLREDVRFAASAVRAEPLVASEETLARARRRSARDERAESAARALAGGKSRSREELDAEEARARERWSDERASTDDDPVVRLTNVLLLDHPIRAPGAVLRVEAGDGVSRGGMFGSFEWPGPLFESAPPMALQGVIWRLKHMSAMALGVGSHEEWLRLRVGREKSRDFYIYVEPTERGDVALVLRAVPWLGSELPRSHEWSAHRSALDEVWRALDEGRADRMEYARRAALETAERIGEAALLEVVGALIQLAAFLDREQRESEARPLAERALSLVEEHELGGRVRGDIEGLLGCIEIDDLGQRVELFERAEATYRAPGPAMRVTTHFAIEVALGERYRERHEASLSAAERALAGDRRWFGATTPKGVYALVQASLACAALERAADAEVRAREALGIAEKSFAVEEDVHWALGRAALASGNADRAVSELSRARQFFKEDNRRHADWPPIALDLALAHEALGQLGEARGVALWARQLVKEPANAAAHRGLEALLARAGPYR